MSSKIEELMAPFLDPIGRVSDKPVNQEYGITDNPLLFTGEVALLLSFKNQIGRAELARLGNILAEVEVYPGLFRRQPEYYQTNYNIPRNAVSHDEYNGVCFMVAAIPSYLRHYAISIVDYGKRFGWQYNDIAPRANFFEALTHAPFRTLKQLSLFLWDCHKNPQNQDSVDLRHPGDIIALGQWRQPRDRAFYKIAAGYRPTIFETAYLALATVFSSSGDPYHSRGGTKLMAWFRMLAIRRLNGESFLLKIAHKLFERNLTKKLGTDYPLKLVSNYFDRTYNGLRHPMINMIEEYITLQKK